MSDSASTLHVVREALLPTADGSYLQRWYVYQSYLPVEVVNFFIHKKSRNSPGTGKTYAYHLASWLNFLSLRKKNIEEACRDDVDIFIDYLLHGMHQYKDVLTLNSRITYSTLSGFITTIQGFYRWFDGLVDIFSRPGKKRIQVIKARSKARHSYLYGQIYEVDIETLIDMEHRRLKPSGFKKHWLTKEEKMAILDNFNRLRDKAIFMLLCEGMRIDEVLSIKFFSYDRNDLTVRPSRSKGYGEEYADRLRIVAFSDPRTAEYLDNYIATERADVEADMGEYLDYMFINLKKACGYGKPVTYRNYWEILKTASQKAGLDPAEIATHVGRRTKIQEMLEDNESEEIIRQVVGWASAAPLDSYRDHQSKVVIKKAAERVRQRRSGV